jgi:hypothetical protein
MSMNYMEKGNLPLLVIRRVLSVFFAYLSLSFLLLVIFSPIGLVREILQLFAKFVFVVNDWDDSLWGVNWEPYMSLAVALVFSLGCAFTAYVMRGSKAKQNVKVVYVEAPKDTKQEEAKA